MKHEAILTIINLALILFVLFKARQIKPKQVKKRGPYKKRAVEDVHVVNARPKNKKLSKGYSRRRRSVAVKKHWASLSPDERAKRKADIRVRMQNYWNGKTPEEKQAHLVKMAIGRALHRVAR